MTGTANSLLYNTSAIELSLAEEAIRELPQFLGTSNLMVKPVWYFEEWSKTFLVENNHGKKWFLKGTPRSRREAEILQVLWRESPECIPRLLESDIVPESETRWFLLENAGTVSQQTTDVETACLAVETLGRLQKKLETNKDLKTMLPDCTAQGLKNVAMTASKWICDTAVGDEHRLAKEYTESLRLSDEFFERLHSTLGTFPATCVHGDFWSGNWGISDGVIRIFDWGDALWGVGGLSIASLLAQHSELSSSSEEIWQVYGDAIEGDISPEYQQMCFYALDVASLVIDVEICRVCHEPPYGLDTMLITWKRLNDHAATF